MRNGHLLLSTVAPNGKKAVAEVDTYLRQCGLPNSLIELVKMRASQINGCAFCLDRHSRDARRQGESEQRLYVLSGWRESPLYTPAERVALAWTDALTHMAEAEALDADYTALKVHFSDKEIVDLTLLIGHINLLNRIAIGLGYVHNGESREAASRYTL